MARFDVYLARRGHLLDVQSDLLETLRTRIVVPLVPPTRLPQFVKGLNPSFDVAGKELVMMTQLIAAIPRAELGAWQASLAGEADAITRALDLAQQGF